MIIPQAIRDKWESLKISGDIKEMANGDNSLRTYISYALNGKDCSEETFIIIRDFYNKRENLLMTALQNEY